MSAHTCTDCGIPMVPRTRKTYVPPGHARHDSYGRCSKCAIRVRRASKDLIKPTRDCDIQAALAGTCTCDYCEAARSDRESPMDAGYGVPERHGIRRWVG